MPTTLRYIAVKGPSGEITGLCRILQDDTRVWGEEYAFGKWINEPSVVSAYIREEGMDEFFHDENRAQQIIVLLDKQFPPH